MRQAMARMRRVSRPTAASLETHVRFTKHLERAQGAQQSNRRKSKGPTLVESRSGGARGDASGDQRTDLSHGWTRSTSKTHIRSVHMVRALRRSRRSRSDDSTAPAAVNMECWRRARSAPAAEDCRADGSRQQVKKRNEYSLVNGRRS